MDSRRLAALQLDDDAIFSSRRALWSDAHQEETLTIWREVAAALKETLADRGRALSLDP